MKKIIENIIWGRDTRLNGLIALTVVALIALGCTCGKDLGLSNSSSNSSGDSPFSTSSDNDSDTDSEMPGGELLNALVKETTADFAAAISTGDFSKLYEKASTDFKATYTLDQTEDVFKDFVTKKSLVSPILAKAIGMKPEFSPEPSIRTEKGLSILVANGKYPTKPVPTNFEYEYVKRNGSWKMLKLVVKLK
jgi:hypothetical protein